MSNYQELSSRLKSILGLKGSPVAVKLAKSMEEVPPSMQKTGEKVRHCEFVQKARHGEKFYATKEQHACTGGAGALGIEEIPEKIKTGEFYYGLGRFQTLEAAKKTMEAVPKNKEKFVASLYAPLEEADFKPDVVVIIGNPKQILKISQANIYHMGGRNVGDFAGIQSLCADAVAKPYMSKEINYTFGCDGSRKYAKVADDELIAGIPIEKLEELVSALEKITK